MTNTVPVSPPAFLFDEGAERRQRELEAMLTMPRAAYDAWDAVVRLNEAAVRTWDFLGAHPDRRPLLFHRGAYGLLRTEA